MYTVCFILRNSPHQLIFCFKAFKAADDLYRKATTAKKAGEILECEDEFELISTTDMTEVANITRSQYEKDMDRNGDLMIIQKKAELKTNTKAQNDIGLQMLQRPTGPQLDGLVKG